MAGILAREPVQAARWPSPLHRALNRGGQSHFQAGCLPRGASGYISWMITGAQWDAGFTVPSQIIVCTHISDGAVVLINVSISTQNLLGRVSI